MQDPLSRSVSQKQKMENESRIETMLKQGVIKVPSSLWSSPIVLVKKKDNRTTRFCVDHRKLNAVTRKDSYSYDALMVPLIHSRVPSTSRPLIFSWAIIKLPWALI